MSMKKPLIALNGQDILGYNLVPVEGTIEALLAPRKYKKPVENESAAIHGTRIITTPSKRKYDKGSLSLSFMLYSESMEDLDHDVDNLQQLLADGVDGSGVNELLLAEYGVCLRLYFNEIKKYSPWYPYGKATLTLSFTEINPNNRSIPNS